MDENIQMMKHSVALSETIHEAVEHLQQLLSHGEFKNTMYMAEDVVKGFAAIQKSLELLKEDVDLTDVDSAMQSIQEALGSLVAAYEQNHFAKIRESVQFILAPRVSVWKRELEKAFKPYLVS